MTPNVTASSANGRGSTEATAARDQEVFGRLIRGTGDLLANYTDDQLRVIRDFLDRARQLTATYADALAAS
jgi:hypothetical protein